jgi:NitT/TauT family transport system ATP-binding protein
VTPSPPAPLVIDVRRLEMRYRVPGGAVVALAGIDVSAAAGEFVTVVGPSGCGKTTLLRILAGLVPRTGGEARINGQPVTGPTADIGIVFQVPALMAWRSVLGNILLQVEIRRLDVARYRDRALDLIKLVGLSGFEDRYPYQLSGGMQQRVSICRALVHDPSLLLMDEPFGALDALTREHMNVELQRIWLERRKTVLFITHSILEAVFLSDRVLVMSPRPGRILDTVEVGLGRPRGAETMQDPRYHALVGRVRGAMQASGGWD